MLLVVYVPNVKTKNMACLFTGNTDVALKLNFRSERNRLCIFLIIFVAFMPLHQQIFPQIKKLVDKDIICVQKILN